MKNFMLTFLCALVFMVASSINIVAQMTVTIQKDGKAPTQSRTGNELNKMAINYQVVNGNINEVYRVTLNKDKTGIRYLDSYSLPFDLHVARSNGESYILRDHGTFSTSAGSRSVTISIPALSFNQTMNLPGGVLQYDSGTGGYIWSLTGQSRF